MKRRLLRALLAATVGLVAWFGYRAWVGDPEPALDDGWHSGHRILDRDGRLLRELPSELGAKGHSIPLEEMGDRLVLATLVSEDKRFYEHGGVDLLGVLRALGQNVRHLRVVSGASTVTQQLVKLLDTEGRPPSERRAVSTKIRESARAQNLEDKMDKRAILEAYLNRLSYGRGVVGPAAASEGYFGVSPRDLSWAQAALLAVLPRAPSYLDPHRHPERSRKRQRALLDALHDQGFLSQADHRRSMGESLTFRAPRHPFEAPHFTEALVAGGHGGLHEGASTRTTLELDLQHDLEALVDAHEVRLAPRRASGAAVLVVDNQSGEVLAYVGNADWEDERAGQVNLVRARRQPGSALKPFVYAMAFEGGLQPSALLADVPTRFGEEDGSYAPHNFDGSFVGPISAREALAGSLNVPAVRLASTLPRGALLERLRRLGLASLDRDADHYGLALALGSGEVTLAELAQAYVALAREGWAIPLRWTADDGLAGAAGDGERVIEAASAAAVIDALSDPLARVRGLGSAGPFDVGFPVAVKTGTSSGYRDTWAVGFTHERTVAVWVGNADGRATDELTGGSGAGPLFADSIRRAMRDVGVRAPLFDAAALVETAVCPLSGQPAGQACPHAVPRRWVPRQGEEPERCTLHHHARPTAAGFVCDAAGPASIVVLPERFDGWLASQPAGAPGWDPAGRPWLAASAVSGCSQHAVAARLEVLDPAPGAVLLSRGHAGERMEVVASLVGAAHESIDVEFVVDGAVVARSAHPYRADVALTPGDHVLEVRPTDPRAPVRLAATHFSVR
jgi:penicillin-binding protein 1C